MSIILLALIKVDARAQTRIEGRIDGWPNQRIYLQEYEGYRSPNVDTVLTDSQGHFGFYHTAQYRGLHRLLIDAGESTGEQVYVDLILKRDSVVFQCSYPEINRSLRLLKSPENRALHRFLKSKNELDYRQAMLQELLEKYPVKNKFTRKAGNELQKVKKRKKKEYSQIVSDSAGHPLTSTYLRLWHQFEQLKISKDRFWEDIDFSSPLLLRTNVVSQKMLEYFRLYQNETGDAAQMRKFIDGILDPQLVNLPLWQNSFAYLQQGFSQMGSAETLQYLKTKLEAAQSCESPLMGEIENEIQTLKALELDQAAPGISLPDEQGDVVELSTRESKILIFWSPDCPHCRASVEDWRAIAESYPGYEMVTVAIYGDKAAWQQFLNEHQFNFSTNLIDTAGWRGAVAKSYRIARTPTYFVLSSENKIMGKPGNLRALGEWLDKQ